MTQGGENMFEVFGWIFVAAILLQTLAAAARHQRVYTSMAMRARLDPESGTHSDDPINPFADRLASRYMRNSIIWSTLKFAAALILANILWRM